MKLRIDLTKWRATPRDGTIKNLFNLMLMKTKVNFQKGQVTSNVDRSFNQLTFF